MQQQIRITAWVALLAVVWIFGAPPSTGPDEPVHIVRSAALVRGEPTGEPTELSSNLRIHELPGTIGYPDHGCFSLQALQPVTCAFEFESFDGDVPLGTTAWHYPVWGHVLPGLGTLVPGEAGNRAARLADAAIPVLLIGWALTAVRRRGATAAGTALMALTPMLWFSVAVVNPSGLVVAGGFALWVGLLGIRRHGPTNTAAWLVAAGWAAAALPRRDGLLWAALAVSVWVLLSGVSPMELLRRLGRGPQVLMAASTIATLIWAVTNKTDSARILVVAPLLPFVAEAVKRMWIHPAVSSTARRAGLAVGLGAVTAAASLVVMSQRAGGFDASFLQRLIGQSGNNIEEAIGILGWLDIPLPTTALFAWLVVLGVVVGLRVIGDDRHSLFGAALVVAVAVPSAWIVEMVQGNNTGTYFQGRYYLPLLIAVPLLLGHRGGACAAIEPGSGSTTSRSVLDDPAVERRIGAVTAAAGLGLGSLAFAAALRRWGVGIEGSLLPWRWDTYPTVLPPVFLLFVMLVASGGLGYSVMSGAGGDAGVDQAGADRRPVRNLTP